MRLHHALRHRRLLLQRKALRLQSANAARNPINRLPLGNGLLNNPIRASHPLKRQILRPNHPRLPRQPKQRLYQ